MRDIIETHHEREDGSGYPSALAGDAIPLFGRIAGIVDSFDAMTSARPYRASVSKYEALQQMYRARGRLFQADLVEQFVQCLGVYPVGTLVELSTGEVAVVMAQNPIRRLFPRVMLLTDVSKNLRKGFEPLDLRDTLAGGKASMQVNIRKSLPVGAYGLDTRETVPLSRAASRCGRRRAQRLNRNCCSIIDRLARQARRGRLLMVACATCTITRPCSVTSWRRAGAGIEARLQECRGAPTWRCV